MIGARITIALGFDKHGRRYRRGYRLHCAHCGTLGYIANYSAVGNQVTMHNRRFHAIQNDPR